MRPTFEVQVVQEHQHHVGVHSLERFLDQSFGDLGDPLVGLGQEGGVLEVH